MKKRFLSLLLTAALIVGLIPAMTAVPVMAAGGTPVLVDDFENFTVGDVFVNSAVTDANAESNKKVSTSVSDKWAIGRDVKAEVVNITGADGDATNKAMKFTLWRGGADGSSSNHPVRIYPTYSTTQPSSGKVVLEMNIYHPAVNDTKFALKMMGMFYRQGRIYIGSDYTSGNDVCYLNDDAWNKLTVITDVSANTTMVYLNDELVSYKEFAWGNTTYWIPTRFEVVGCNDIAQDYVIFDDVNWYLSPSATTVSSTFPAIDATEVSRTAKPTFTFNEKLLDWEYNSAATAVITNTTDSTTVEATLSQSADGKTLTVTPAANLDYGKTYSVALSGVKDMYDAAVTVAPITFTTMSAPNYEVTAPVFTKENLFTTTPGTTITRLENGAISCSYSITNNEATEKPVLMLVVLKENDLLKSFQFKTANVASGDTLTFNGGFSVGDAANSVIECYTWDSLTSMKPLGAEYYIDAAGQGSSAQ